MRGWQRQIKVRKRTKEASSCFDCDVVGEEANGNQDMQESHLRQETSIRQTTCRCVMDDEADESTASIVSKSTDKWEEEEAQLERRRNRRRKQFAEAAAELAKQRRSDLRRREAEAELARIISRTWEMISFKLPFKSLV